MKERDAVMYIARKTRENSLILPGKVVFGLWKRESGAVCITDELDEVVARISQDHEIICVYADGCELDWIGRRYGEYGEMVHMNRRLYEKIRSM